MSRWLIVLLLLLFFTLAAWLCSKKFEFLQHEWLASWAPETDEDKKHLSTLNLTHRLKVFGACIPFLDLHVSAMQVGLLVIRSLLVMETGQLTELV